MERNPQNWTATIIGAILLLIGILGFVNNPLFGLFPVNALHNVIHLLAGAVLLWAGVWGNAATARTTNLAFGVIFAILALLGVVAPAFLGVLLQNSPADIVLHVVLAAALLLVSLGSKQG